MAEQERVEHCLDVDSMPRIVKVLETELLLSQVDAIMDMPNGLDFLLEHNRFEGPPFAHCSPLKAPQQRGGGGGGVGFVAVAAPGLARLSHAFDSNFFPIAPCIKRIPSPDLKRMKRLFDHVEAGPAALQKRLKAYLTVRSQDAFSATCSPLLLP